VENKIKKIELWLLFIILLIPALVLIPKLIQNSPFSPYRSPWDKKVLAFYYGWFGLSNNSYGPEAWTNAVHRLNQSDPNNGTRPYITCDNWPALGLYNSSDPSVVLQHQLWAEQAGLDAFICSWWGPGNPGDKNLQIQMDLAVQRNSSLEFCIDYETMIAVNANDTAQKILDDFEYIFHHYVDVPDSHFLMLDGKPVIYLYRADWIMPAEWRKVFSSWTHPFFIIADLFPPIQGEFLSLFDGLHQYDTTQALNIGRDLPNLFESMAEISHNHQKLYSACVLPGFNKSQLKGYHYFELPRNQGNTYRDQWNAAISADADWISIVSWSEWAEGTQIEPAVEYSDLYLNLTREFATKWKSR
jgi:hypothetical protein